jgi:acyl carrier protein
MDEIKPKVKAVICKILEIAPADLDDQAVFAEDERLKFDSIIGLDLLADLEKQFKIRIPENYLARMTSVENVAGVVAEVIGGIPAGGGGSPADEDLS